MEKVVGRANVEFKCRIPVFGQLGFRCLDVYGLRIALRTGNDTLSLQPNLWILSCVHPLVHGCRDSDRSGLPRLKSDQGARRGKRGSIFPSAVIAT